MVTSTSTFHLDGRATGPTGRRGYSFECILEIVVGVLRSTKEVRNVSRKVSSARHGLPVSYI